MNKVNMMAHECSVDMFFWLLDNVVDVSMEPRFYVNNVLLQHPIPRSEMEKVLYFFHLVNSNRNPFSKTHTVVFEFENEEDAAWFKLTWCRR